ncbi:zincin-like metallopeptidase domain-containing protein [Aeromonas media]|uniref:zincin-like metallopeptidase domain-containing protein n=1 Tax=Aeromonas media TaxID=651 RepID=UPI003D1D1492
MAKKPYSKSKAKKSYLTPDLVNKVSEVFNALIFKAAKFDPEEVKLLTLNAWNEAVEKMKADVSPSVIKDAEESVSVMFDAEPEQWVESVNKTLDKYRRQSDVSLSRAKIDMLRMWHDMAYGDQRSFDIPWLRHMTVGEKFMPFLEKDERYVFKGFTNQSILAYAIEERDGAHDNVVLFKGELEKLLAHDFEKNPDDPKSTDEQRKSHVFGKLKGIPSLTSLFVPSGYTTWVTESGQKWVGENGEKKPSVETIMRENLKAHENKTFVSHPVWTISSIEHLISKDAVEALSKLREVRAKKSDFVLKPEDTDLNDVIDNLINKQVEQQKITCYEGGNQAFYKPVEDTMRIPTREQFVNPVARYATWSHELAHSTKHMLGRPALNKFGSVPYGIEEVVAESVANLMVKDLHEKMTEIRGGKLPDEWQGFFDNYSKNATSYGAGWGGKFDFKQHFERIYNTDQDNKSKQILSKMMGDVLNAMMLIKNGAINDLEVTTEFRNEKLKENIEKSRSRSAERDSEPGI